MTRRRDLGSLYREKARSSGKEEVDHGTLGSVSGYGLQSNDNDDGSISNPMFADL